MAAKEAFQLLKFDDFCRAFQRVIKYLETHKELMDAHMVDFFTSAHWETLLPRQIREDLELLQHEDLTALPTACNHESGIFDKFGENLKQFLTEATQAQLKSFSWVRDGRDFSSECKVNFIPHKIMTPKKSYEVEVMSDIINRLSTQFQVRKILDLGSGKGYLSQYLALQYGLKVIGVDSSHSNTESAIKRNGKLLKSWEGLLKKSRNEKVKHLGGSISGGNDSSTRQTVGDSSLKGACFTCTSLSNNDCDFNNKETCALGQDDKKSLVSDPHEAGRMLSPLSKYSIHVNPEKPLHKKDFPVPASQSFNMNPSNEHFPSSAEECNQVGWNNSSVIATSHYDEPSAKSQTSFLPVTGFVDQSFVANGELRKLFDQLTSSGEGNYCPNRNGTFLIGLHTCGDLVPMALRIFVSEPSVKLICIVGCCYHLVSQRFGKERACSSDEPGFPMSKFLKSFRLQISRNATMVAQQAAERISSESKVPPPSVLYRAILQVILKEKFGLDGRGLAVGKAGSKCKSFKEYVHKCLIKLGLQDRVSELSDEELESFHGRFKSKEKQLHAFYQLRAAIAPCIESVFILDRLCYLYEEGFKSACIMRVFDPVKSPRCYAIIASKM